MPNNPQTPTFRVGICMAGAISAGAYTAGVMDYLLEALENWQKAKYLVEEGATFGPGDYDAVPKHNFLIEVIGGASAGGMTAAITAAATQIEFDPLHQKDIKDEKATKQNPLYNSWVNLTEIPGSDMMDQMLNTDDINANEGNLIKEVRAGLNSTFIKKIADDVLDKSVESIYQRPYIASDADIFTTVTNLRGFDYSIIFRTTSGPRSLKMRMHKDYAFFKISEKEILGDSDAERGRIPVHFNSPRSPNLDILKQAAMATGAFPIGLESREIDRGREYIESNRYLNLSLSIDTDSAKPLIHDDEKLFQTLNVDGGVINNEPIEITQSLLDDRRTSELPEGSPPYKAEITAATFDSTVIMIDPFPNDEDSPAVFTAKKAWRNVIPSIISAMRGQLMMKEDQIRRAYLSDDYTRFLIMPVRSGTEDTPESDAEAKAFPIACGSLGGFGGFFSKQFRTHDYFLGRRNCQKFLQEHFSAPVTAGNPILSYGYEGTKKFVITTKDDKGEEKTYLPLLPDFRVVGNAQTGYRLMKPEVEAKYPYPKIKLSYLLSLKDKIQDRIECILDNIENIEPPKVPVKKFDSKILPRIHKKSVIGEFFKGKATSAYLSIGKFFGKKTLADSCVDMIIVDMERRNLIEVDR